jgi:hypothetical protein
MTGRRVLLACIVTLGVVGLPQPAAAWPRWLGFLEELSGPGPFKGGRLGVVLFCVPDAPETPSLAWAGSLECRTNEPLPEIVVEFSRYESLRNDLFPEDPESVLARVRINTLEGSMVMPVAGSKVVFLGAGLGVQRFSGNAFESFLRPSIHANLRIYPMGELRQRWLRRLVVLSWVPTLVFPGYDWRDFGAPSGTFSESVDLLSGRLHVTFDLTGLIDR